MRRARKEKQMKMNDELRRWRLQLFAEGDGDGQGDGNGSGDGNGDSNGAGEGNKKDGSFDDFLSDPKNQAEFDRRLAKALETQKAKLEDEYKQNVSSAKKEAEKLAKMNADQKAQYEQEKLRAENDELKAQVSRIELGKTATALLKEQKIEATQDILDFVVGSDADSTKANIDKFVGIIQAAIKAAEFERAKGKTPPSYRTDNGDGPDDVFQAKLQKYRK